MGSRKRKTARRRIGPFSRGQLNAAVDTLVHPMFRKSKAFILVDGALHGLIEQDVSQSIEKFVRFDVPKLLKRKGRRRRKGLA